MKRNLHATPTKIKAIAEAPAPSNLTQLRGFLGLIKFLPNLSHTLQFSSPEWTDMGMVSEGAVLSHVSNNGSEHPIAYASRSLSKSEKNYAQIEKRP